QAGREVEVDLLGRAPDADRRGVGGGRRGVVDLHLHLLLGAGAGDRFEGLAADVFAHDGAPGLGWAMVGGGGGKFKAVWCVAKPRDSCPWVLMDRRAQKE